MPYAAKAKTQQFARRKPNLMKKADQLARLCHADVALIIRRNGRYYTYRSTDHERWPPTMLEIKASYPLPINLLPEDFDHIFRPTMHKSETEDLSTKRQDSIESSKGAQALPDIEICSAACDAVTMVYD